MTATTRAQKLKARRGRPRLPNLARTETGRISRTSTQTQARKETEAVKAMATVIDMRSRLHGATGANAKDPLWGFVLGRIYIDGNIGTGNMGKLRLEAGNRYALDMGRYYGLTGIPFPSARAQSLFHVPGSDGEPSSAKARSARDAANQMMALESALLQSKHGRNAASTVKNICLLDLDEARGWPAHMFEYLRSGLDALVWKYGLQSQR